VILINLGRVPYVVVRATRVAQLVVAPVSRVIWGETSVDGTETARGAGGFGSTGLEVPNVR
jgi:dUTP pyrophosphatase